MTPYKTKRCWTSAMVLGTVLAALAQGAIAGSAEPMASGRGVPDRAPPQIVLGQASPGAESETKPAPESQGDLASMTIELAARPVAMIRGKVEGTIGFETLVAAIAKVDAAIGAAGLARGGRPFAVFLETDEESFQFQAMIPLAEKPQGKLSLADGVEIGASPAGKAIKFQHRGPYDDIESTYTLINAFLDEKGLEAQNLYIEEYLSDTKESDDVALEADIYVFIK
jgi:effector-binding domain-containing protein